MTTPGGLEAASRSARIEAGRGLRGRIDREAGPAGDDEVGEKGELLRAVPLVQGQEGIRTEEEEELVFREKGGSDRGEHIDGVVGLAVAARRVEGGRDDCGVAGSGPLDHGEAICVGGGESAGFERLRAHRGHPHCVEGKPIDRRSRYRQVPAMRRVETSTEKTRCASSLILNGRGAWECRRLSHDR